MNDRLQEFDIIRIIAALSVIAIHVTAGYIQVLSLSYYVNHLVRYAVPMFIILSGFLLCYADSVKPPLTTLDFYLKRGKRVLLPYLLWSLLYSTYNQLSGPHPNLHQFTVTISHDFLWGTAHYHLYFFVIIIQLYLLYPLLRKWLEKNVTALLIFSLLVTVAVQTWYYLCMVQQVSLPVAINLIFVRAFPVWVFYFVLGMVIAKKKDYWQQQLPKHTLILSLGWLTTLGLVILDTRLTGVIGSIIRPSVILYTVVTFFFIYCLALQVKPLKKPWLSWLSRQSFLIYLVHPLILSLLMRFASQLGCPALWAGIRGMAALYITVAATTIMFTYLISFTPLTEWIGGAYQKNNHDKL